MIAVSSSSNFPRTLSSGFTSYSKKRVTRSSFSVLGIRKKEWSEKLELSDGLQILGTTVLLAGLVLVKTYIELNFPYEVKVISKSKEPPRGSKKFRAFHSGFSGSHGVISL